MKYPLSSCDFTFPLLSHQKALDVISLLGFQGVDVGVFKSGSHLRADEVIKNPKYSAQFLTTELNQRGLRVCDVLFTPGSDFSELAINHPQPKQRSRARSAFIKALEFTVRCNARHLTCLPGILWRATAQNDPFLIAVDELAWRVEKAESMGISFAVEPHLGSLIPTPELALRLLNSVRGLTLTLDYAHFVAGDIPQRRIEELLDKTSHVHARAACTSCLQSTFSRNSIDFDRMLRGLKRARYSGWIAVEYVWIEWQRCNEVDNISESVQLRDHLLELMS